MTVSEQVYRCWLLWSRILREGMVLTKCLHLIHCFVLEGGELGSTGLVNNKLRVVVGQQATLKAD